MSKFARFASLLFLVAVLSACGAKGALFLPEKPTPVEDAPADATPAEITPATPASDGAEPAELPAEPPVTPPADGNG